MRILTIDYETYWDIDYTLSKMTTEAYVRDPRFKAHMVGVKNGDADTVVVPGHQIQSVFDRIPWHDTAVLCQHAHFDGLIMSHHYGAHPVMFLDTLSMFRHLYPTEACSLANICKVLGLREKGGGYYDIVNTKGVMELSPAEYKKCAWYCGLDCDLTKEIFDILKVQFTVQELKLVNMTVKMFTNPVLELDQELLLEAREDEIVAKAALMERVAHDKESLASNPKFAHILMSMGLDPPKKISPAALKNGKVHMELVGEAPIGLLPDKKAITSYEAAHGEEHPYKYWAYAFGKADEAFKKLLEHDNPDIQAIIEARLGVKSTIKGTRTERLISISTRGTLPIYLLYAGAHTLRWSGGDKINPQNFNRGSKIRESIMAPEGHVIVVRDLSAIEARVLAWVAGEHASVETFRQGIDIYLQMISSIVGRTVTKDEKDLRFIGKAIVLGCLGPETLVLTNRGYTPIVDVQLNDMVWDGEEWVQHQGVIPKGQKTVETAYGLTMTADHEILTEHGWKEWSEVHTNPSLMQSALSLGSSPSLLGNATQTQKGAPVDGTLSLDAPVDGKDTSTVRISVKGAPQDVIPVQNSIALKHESIIGVTRTLSQTKQTDRGCSTEYPHVSADAITQRQKDSSIMGAEGFLYMNLGAQIEKHFLHILSRLRGGIYQSLNLIEAIMKKGTSQVISNFLPKKRIATIGVPSQKCRNESSDSKQRIETYDLAYAGPRNRFTVLSTSGPLLVHNCGYGLGWRKFQSMLRIGMLGDTGRILGRDIADPLGVNLEGFMHRYAGYVSESLPLGADIHAHALHCACAEAIIRAFRDNKPMIPRFWDTCQAAFAHILNGTEFSFGTGGIITTTKEGLQFPTGMLLRYAELECKQEPGKKRKEYSILKKKRSGERGKLYGGLCCENIVQRLARDIIAANMVTIGSRYHIATMTHDEIVCVVPEHQAEECYDYMGVVMAAPPAWAPGLPLASEGGWAKNYSK